MKRKTALVAGLAVLVLLVTVALALDYWPCPRCSYTPMPAYYTCANHYPAFQYTDWAYISEEWAPPPPAKMPCPECGNPCDADSVVCPAPGCDWSWHR